MSKDLITKAVLHIASWYPNPSDPRLGNFVEQHLLSLKGQGEMALLSAFPASKAEVIYSAKPFPQVQVLYPKKTPLWSHYRALKRGYAFLWEQGFRADLAHLHVSYPSGLAFLGFLKELPFVISEHYSGYHPLRQKEWSGLAQKLARRILNRAELVLPVSEALGKTLQDFGLRKDYRVIGNVVNTEIFKYRRPLTKKRFRFLHVSSLQEHTKNISGLLKVFRSLVDVRADLELAIGGDGDLKVLEKQLQSLGFQDHQYQILGPMSPPEVAEEMQRSDAFLLFSKVENQPVVLLESLCCGRPVISTEVGGIAEIVTKENGILIPSESESALRQAMKEMVTNYERFDLEAIATKAQALHSREAIAQKFAEVYSSVPL